MESFFIKIGFSDSSMVPDFTKMKFIAKKRLGLKIGKMKGWYCVDSVELFYETNPNNEIALVGTFKKYDICCNTMVNIVDAINVETPIQYVKILGDCLPLVQSEELLCLIREAYQNKYRWYNDNTNGM